MLSKAQLTSHSRMSGSRWVITPLWLSGLWTSFLYSSSVYSCHLFLISSASVRSIPFLSFIEPIFAWNVPLVPLIFLKRSLVFPILLFSSIFLHWSLWRLSYLSWLFFGTLHSNGNIFPFFLCFSLLFISQLFVRPPQTTILPFCISFPWGEDSWESLGLQGDPTSPSWMRSFLGFHWKDWCWSWNSNTLATWYKELSHLKRPWCWERLRAGGEGDDRGWDGWMASPIWWTWVWVNSRIWWWTGRSAAVLGLQGVGYDWETELNRPTLTKKAVGKHNGPVDLYVLTLTLWIFCLFVFWYL